MFKSIFAIITKSCGILFQILKIILGLVVKTLKQFWKVLAALALLIITVFTFKKTKGE